jgi:hypothetical protein
LQTDPIGFDALDVNLYRYVGNSPLTMIDPLGEMDAANWVREATVVSNELSTRRELADLIGSIRELNAIINDPNSTECVKQAARDKLLELGQQVATARAAWLAAKSALDAFRVARAGSMLGGILRAIGNFFGNLGNTIIIVPTDLLAPHGPTEG